MRKTGTLLIVAVLLGAIASAQTHPNFSGSWKLNVEKSDMGTTGVTAMAAEITHKDPVLSYTVKGTAGGQEFEETESLTTDGKPARDSHGAMVKAYWDGATLVAEGEGGYGMPAYVARITLAADGKSFTRIFKLASDAQPRREIYEKQ